MTRANVADFILDTLVQFAVRLKITFLVESLGAFVACMRSVPVVIAFNVILTLTGPKWIKNKLDQGHKF